ncbi:MAG: ribosome silencing factor [Anaerolineaceae bacterium]|nr:MAG: ribosome silencing factor [Anaerolineaceae bacterium]
MVDDALTLSHLIVDTLEEKKGEDILLLDLVGVCSFTDYFVICTGKSERTLKSLAEETQLRLKSQHSIMTRSVEGDASSGWILLDYGDVILHLFSPVLRDYYRLEDLWRDGQVLVHMQ